MIEYMCAADIFAFPPITKNETFGIALAEAMYCGAVPITFTIEGSGVNYVSIHEKTGIKISIKDSQAIANAIKEIVSSLEKYNMMAQASYESRGTFDFETFKNKILTIFNF